MICKNCANVFEDGFSCCPECGTPIKSNYDVPEEIQGKTDIPPQEVNQDDEPISEPDTHEEDEEEVIPERSEWKPASQKEKSAMKVIVALTVGVFILLGVLTAVGAFTDIFEESDDTVKTIALSGLSSEETKQFENFLSDIGIVAYSDFCQGEDTEGSFVASYLNPGNAGSLYSMKYGAGKVTQSEADPAKRFADENGVYSYFVADASLVKVVLEEFGFTPSGQVNEKNCYYYNGKYYFANSGDAFSSSVKARVISTVRSSDGTYYAQCNFYGANGAEPLETTVIFDKTTVGGVAQWEIIEISRDTYVDSSGVVTKNNKGDLSYEMKKETVENKDESGKVVASVSFEYPSFKGTSTAEKSVNQLYASIIASYKENPALIKENVTVTSRVAYNKNGRLSIVEETVTGNAKIGTVTDENGVSAEGLVLPEKEIDGYILDAETGENLSKSNIFATDYSNVQFALYCIYSGYDMTAEDVPTDTEEIGKAIYASPNAMCEDGYTFFFEKDGYTDRVVIPYSAEGFFAENY